MELEEFRELALQSLPKLARGRTVRYTLVRTPGEFFVSKIHRQQYLDLRSIPIMRNYRFIQSTLTHGEYASFRDDFYRDFDFLKIDGGSFSGIIETARKLGFDLYGFSSSGNGRLDVRSPGKGGRSEDLINLMKENEEKGLKPFNLTFRKDSNRVTVRKDFNYFVHGGYWDALDLIYRTSTSVIEKNLELLEQISRLKLRVKLHENDFVGIEKMSLELDGDMSPGDLLERIGRNFTVGRISSASNRTSVYAFHKVNELSTYRIDIYPGKLDFLPTTGSRMEGILDLIESIREDWVQ